MENRQVIAGSCWTLCKSGNLQKLQHIITQQNINMADFDQLFRTACEYGRLDIAKWLLQIKPDINISADDDEAFQCACGNGHLDVAKWLLQIKPNIDISINNDEAFRYACEDGHLDVAKWLLQIKPNIYISTNNDYAFRWACENGHLHVAKWLLQIKPNIDISINNDEAFRWAYIKGHLDVAQWLCTINSSYQIQTENDKIVSFHVLKQLPIDKTTIISINNIQDKECPICYENTVQKQSNCKHNYCTECIQKHYNNNSSCPICRQQLTTFYNIH
jgi:ankyrin repeat protein